jgi:hypothetical protein
MNARPSIIYANALSRISEELSQAPISLYQMSSTEKMLATMRRDIWPLLETAMEGMLLKSRVVLDAAEQQRAHEIAGIT